jgi:hypothetical protein
MSTSGTRAAVPCSEVPGTSTVLGHFQPTFLYEVIWDVLVCVLLLWADRRFTIGHGRLFALYVMGYTLGRGWIEHLRSDFAHHFLGLRLNDWVAIGCFLAALAYFEISRRRKPGKESQAELYWPHFKPYGPDGTAAADAPESADSQAARSDESDENGETGENGENGGTTGASGGSDESGASGGRNSGAKSASAAAVAADPGESVADPDPAAESAESGSTRSRAGDHRE